MNSLYLLTAYTGRESGSERTTVIGTVEMKWRTFWIAAFALVPGGLLTAIFFPLLNTWAFLWLFVVEGAAFYLIERRSREGLKLRTYQAFLDKRKSQSGTFFLCGQPIEVSGTEFGTIRQITAPVHVQVPGLDPADAISEDFEATTR
jgi:hypothetical protein